MRYLAAALLLAACTPGSVGDDIVGDDDNTLPGTALCRSELTLSGTMISPGGTVPPEEQGCVPQGTWTVNVVVSNVGDCDSAPVPATYTYEVVGTGDDETMTPTNNTDQEAQLGIHANGSGTCEGSFEHIWPVGDGTFHVVLLKAEATSWEQTIGGTGEYWLWAEHP